MGDLAGIVNRARPGENWTAQSGATIDGSPSANWVASDVASNRQRYTDIGVFALYVHELGNLIASQLGIADRWNRNPNDPTDDPDIGQALENCVFGGRVGLRSGRVGNNREL